MKFPPTKVNDIVKPWAKEMSIRFRDSSPDKLYFINKADRWIAESKTQGSQNLQHELRHSFKMRSPNSKTLEQTG